MTFLNTKSLPESYFGKIKNTYQQSSVPVESAPLVEQFYGDSAAIKAMYASAKLKDWLAENGNAMLEFGGGEFGITASMLADAPKALISKIVMENGKKLGARRAKVIVDTAQKIMETEPGY